MTAGDAAHAEQIQARLRAVTEAIDRAGRDPSEVTIVAVTKGRPLAVCQAALAAGLTDLGENRVQEALPKVHSLPAANWHLVGHLQTNKVRQVVGRFHLVQSVDSARLVDELAERSPGQAVLVQVNVAGEQQKHGVSLEQAPALVAYAHDRLLIRGLMCMAAQGGDAENTFNLLRRLRDQAEQRLGSRLPILSMGMSDDYEAAVRAGSNMLRLGRILLGDRAA